MPDTSSRDNSRISIWRALGPGFVVAATGVGAGDLIAAAVAGRRFGLAVLWVVALGAFFKWVLNEGVSRWQLSTGTTLIEGWTQRLPRWVAWYFLAYLLLWSFLVAAALSSACGVAAGALFPALKVPVWIWSFAHALVAFLFVWWGRYAGFERLMKILIGTMFGLVIICALFLGPPMAEFSAGLFVPSIPEGSPRFLLGVLGGVGGSATLLCYGYWIREKGWSGTTMHRRTLFDLFSAYLVTGLFGIALVVIAAQAEPADASGSALILALSDRLGELLGPVGKGAFLIGFWCAVFTSMLGVWQGVPYLFEDTIRVMGKRGKTSSVDEPPAKEHRSPLYRAYLLYLAFPPLIMLAYEKPVAIVILYAVAGAFFMPFLATVLLILNNRRQWVGALQNPLWINLLLTLSLALFGALFVFEVVERVGLAG
jgi:Mn2+/Fe2+ NRAMP family transporter